MITRFTSDQASTRYPYVLFLVAVLCSAIATDVARAFFAGAETPIAGESFNVGAGNPQSVNHLVELLGGETTNIPKRPGEPDCTWADIGKIQRDLGWKQMGAWTSCDTPDAPRWNGGSG